jgi:hypothetical protein
VSVIAGTAVKGGSKLEDALLYSNEYAEIW